MKTTILIVEDEKTISNFISRTLEANQYRPVVAASGAEARTLFFSHCPSLVLLDLGLPDMDGIDLLKEIHEWAPEMPVIIVSARDREAEKVQALDLGADDYITKPFGVFELLARIRTSLRRADQIGRTQSVTQSVYHVQDLTVDIGKHQIFVGGEEIHFTQNEFKIMELLCANAGKVLTYDYIINRIWGPYGSNNNQILRVNMANIRRKLKENPSEPKYILTELGIGYRMLEDGKDENMTD
jgi:two-component system KDP operon response regulator KdpE